MNRLQLELERLYGLRRDAADASPGTRAAVLAVVQPAGWPDLSAAWRGVQADLELPAPAIAVSGADALQLWFSFAAPLAPRRAGRFLEALRARYLPEVAAARVRVAADAATLPPAPGAEVGVQRWSAFVTHDLAAVFADAPWLDLPPNEDGQATLLRMLAPIGEAALSAALAGLGVEPVAADPPAASNPGAADLPAASAPAGPSGATPPRDPARFLAEVMDDPAAPLAQRIEAARILLRHARRSTRPG